MKTFFLVLLLVVLLGVILPFAYFYWRFHQSPAKLWTSRLFRLREELFARRRVLMAGASEPASALRQLADDYFKTYLSGLPTTALVGRPGIGPGTAEKLRQVGLKSVADLRGFVFESVPGIGPTKGAELRTALAAVVEECRSKFDAGACREGQDFRAAAAMWSAERQRKEQADLTEAKAIDETLGVLTPLFRVAESVTFGAFLTRQPSGVPEAVLAAPLPVVSIPELPAPPAPVIPTPPPVAVSAPAFARKSPTPVVLPPRPTEPKPVASKDLFEDMLSAAISAVEAIPQTPTVEPVGLAKMKALARFGLMVSKSDGRITQAERMAVREYLEHKFGGDPVLIRHIDVTMEEVGKAIPNEADAVAGVLGAVAEGERLEVYAWVELIADATGKRNTKETELLGRLRGVLAPSLASRVSDDAGSSKPDPLQGRLAKIDPRALLDIAADTELTVELIRRRYALLSEKLDPAKAAAMGAEFAKLAVDKRAALTAAAEELLKPFGEPLEKPDAPVSSEMRHNPDLDDAFGM